MKIMYTILLIFPKINFLEVSLDTLIEFLDHYQNFTFYQNNHQLLDNLPEIGKIGINIFYQMKYLIGIFVDPTNI